MKLYLYLIYQTENLGYDTYDSGVVIAESEEEARNMNPDSGAETLQADWDYRFSAWCSSPDKVSVRYLGEAKEGSKKGSICSSFNAG
jgi:hypothetical protein